MKIIILVLALLICGCQTLDKSQAGKITTIGKGINDSHIQEAKIVKNGNLI